MAKILWMDNDRTFLWPHEARLKGEGHQVIRAYSVSEAETLLRDKDDWNLVIIDVMMNISKEEEKDYPPSRTDSGHNAGFVFYERNKSRIKKIGATAIVLTMRGDSQVVTGFKALEMSDEEIRYKIDVSDTADFIEWINKCLEKGEEHE